jgi:hypothetical protein
MHANVGTQYGNLPLAREDLQPRCMMHGVLSVLFSVPASSGSYVARSGCWWLGGSEGFTFYSLRFRPAGMPSSTAPPPWLTRMAVLGVPPKYAEHNEQQEGEAAAVDGEQLMVFFNGSEDEGEEGEAADSPDAGQGEDAAAEAAAAANGVGAAAAAGVDDGGGADVNGAAGISSSSAGDGDDFIPFAGDSVAAAGQQQEQTQEQQQQEPPPVQSQEEAEVYQDTKAPAQEQQQQQQQQANGTAHPKPPKWAFPGVNAALPEDCTDKDGWTAALQTAAWLQTRLA